MPLDTSIKKVLVIGSGPIVIGQAAEFDYAGAQACRVFKEAGVNVVLCNSNPATIMTDQAMADEIYLEPLTAETLKRVIRKEQPDSLLAGLGGQTGLTLAMELSKEGFLQEQNVRLLGTDAAAISRAEDRELFKELCLELGEPVVPSEIANDLEEAAQAAADNRVAATMRSPMTVYSPPDSVLPPSTAMVELPAPFTWHPMAHRKSWRSVISGSRAALRSTVSP